MKPETEAKAIIALIISLIAFGFGSGAGIVMALNQNDTTNSTQISNNQDIPQIPSTKNVNIQTTPQTNSDYTGPESTYTNNGGSDTNNDSTDGDGIGGNKGNGDSGDKQNQ